MKYQDPVEYQDPVAGSPSDVGRTDVAKEQAGRVGQQAAEAGGQVAQTTKEQARNVVGEAKQQARDLVGEARTQVRDQAGTQRDRAVQGLRSLSDELDQMAQQSGASGVATEVARQLSTRTRDLAGHLERHEPSDLLEQVRSYARRRPMVFLAGAALAGVVAGRLTKSLAAGTPDGGRRALTSGYDDGYASAPPLAVGAAPYATSDYPSAGYEPSTGYEPGTGYQEGTGQAGTGYQTPAYGTDAYRASDDYGTAAGGFREPDAGLPDSGYGDTPAPGSPPPAATYEPVPEADEPSARGWTP